MSDFIKTINEHMAALSEIVTRYQVVIDAPEPVTDEARMKADEQQLFSLFDAYLESAAFLRKAKAAREAAYWNAPKMPQAAGLAEIRAAELVIERAAQEYAVLAAAEKVAEQIVEVIKKQLYQVMPKYVWIAYNGRHFGIDTGLWGGWHCNLRIVSDGEKRYELRHVTEYN
jgi:hypothetical protein